MASVRPGRTSSRVVELFTQDPLMEGKVDYLEDRETPANPRIQRELVELFEACHTLIFHDYPKKLEGALPEEVSYLVCRLLLEKKKWKQQILELRSDTDRQDPLLAYLPEWTPHLHTARPIRQPACGHGHVLQSRQRAQRNGPRHPQSPHSRDVRFCVFPNER